MQRPLPYKSSSVQPGHETEIKISERGKIDERFYGHDETDPSGKVATSVSCSVSLGLLPLSEECREGRRCFVTAKAVTQIPV